MTMVYRMLLAIAKMVPSAFRTPTIPGVCIQHQYI